VAVADAAVVGLGGLAAVVAPAGVAKLHRVAQRVQDADLVAGGTVTRSFLVLGDGGKAQALGRRGGRRVAVIVAAAAGRQAHAAQQGRRGGADAALERAAPAQARGQDGVHVFVGRIVDDLVVVVLGVARFTVTPPPFRRRTPWEYFLGLGELLFKLTDHARDLLRLIGQLMLDLMRLVRDPRDGPWRDVTGHIYQIGATALPITALVGFLIGVVLAYLTSQQLRLFGAEIYIVNILGLSLIRELGPVLAAVLIAGRSGSAITAQIGVMRVTEELDAMRVMGIPQGFRLVMPRAMAMALAMPLITLWTTVSALVGGMLAADLVLGITPSYFINNLPRAVMVSNLWLAMGKSVVFGLMIALIGCHYGLRVKPNTESLGQGTTASVVTSITVVILIDALFAVIFKNIGI
jgi:phospholipid/cholesterol/gamma-HCH transport system permease protein